MTNGDPLFEFHAFMVSCGLVPPDEIVADGNLHRCDAEGRGGEGDGAYLLHLDGVPAGGCQNWRAGDWQSWRASMSRALTPEEECQYRERMAAARKQREAERERRATDARNTAQKIWLAALPAPADHPYLDKKGIQPHSVRFTASGLHASSLIVPIYDAEGVLHSLQFIAPDGHKLYLPGGRVSGCYFAIGKPNGILCIAEGFATAATVYESTGHAVVVAFSAGNLLAVAEALHADHPDQELVVCADDDHLTSGNPGVTKAREAALVVGGKVAVPVFGPNRLEKATDFNDLAALEGPLAVQKCIDCRMDPRQTTTEPEAAQASPADTSRRPWIVGDLRRMLTEDPPPIRWLVPGLIPAGVPGILAGRASVGKSSTALLIGMSLAAGHGVLGREVSREAARGVVYVSLEDDQDEIHRRVRRVEELLAEDPTWTNEFPKNLAHRFVPLFPNRASGATFSLEAQWKEIADRANAIPGGSGLIVLDTLARLSLGDENSSKDMRPFMEAMAALCDATGSTVMAVHHVGKGHDANSDRKLWDRLHPEALRGSSALEGAARFVIQLAAISPSEAEAMGLDTGDALRGAYVALALTKASSAEKGATVLMERRRADDPGAGFLCPHPESERMLAILQGQAAVIKLQRRDQVLLAIAEAGNLGAVDKASEASRIWPDSASPTRQWDKMTSGLRKAGLLSDLHLTQAGWAAAKTLGFRSSARNIQPLARCSNSHTNKDVPGGTGEAEQAEHACSFRSAPLGVQNGTHIYETVVLDEHQDPALPAEV